MIADYIPSGQASRQRPMDGRVLWTITEVAAHLQLSRSSVERLVARGRLQAVHPVPGSLRFRPEDVTAYVAGLAPQAAPSQTVQPPQQVAMTAHRIGALPMNRRARKMEQQ